MITDKETLIHICRVESVVDDEAGLRIKVKLPNFDDNLDIDEWPYVYPLLPKHLHINPKVGESVLVILQRQGAGEGIRFFIGPLVSQQYMLGYDPHFNSKTFLNNTRTIPPEQNPEMDPENEGSIPNREDVAIQGRENSDIVLKNNEVRIRCGFKSNPKSNTVNKRLHFNKKNPSYIQMKYAPKVNVTENNGGYSVDGVTNESSINVVADKINLLSHISNTYFNLTDRQNMISDEELVKIEKLAHAIPYGDVLVEYLIFLTKLFMSHVHPFPGLSPSFTLAEKERLDSALKNMKQDMLSKSIKVN